MWKNVESWIFKPSDAFQDLSPIVRIGVPWDNFKWCHTNFQHAICYLCPLLINVCGGSPSLWIPHLLASVSKKRELDGTQTLSIALSHGGINELLNTGQRSKAGLINCLCTVHAGWDVSFTHRPHLSSLANNLCYCYSCLNTKAKSSLSLLGLPTQTEPPFLAPWVMWIYI